MSKKLSQIVFINENIYDYHYYLKNKVEPAYSNNLYPNIEEKVLLHQEACHMLSSLLNEIECEKDCYIMMMEEYRTSNSFKDTCESVSKINYRLSLLEGLESYLMSEDDELKTLVLISFDITPFKHITVGKKRLNTFLKKFKEYYTKS
jgi:hypothetical protein